MKEEEKPVGVCSFFLWLLVAAVMILVFTGCTTVGRTTMNEDSLICLGFCMETEFETNTEVVKE